MKPARSLRGAAELIEHGIADGRHAAELERVAARYAVAITPAMAELINPADPSDPIGRQFVPDPAELRRGPHESADPIGDDPHSPVEGLVHRYPDRVLLKLVNVCAVYCRFCFRRETVGPGEGALSPAALRAALAYIGRHPEIWEVILSGGDPLMLAAKRLRRSIAALAAIAHVKVIRAHTRVPVVDPDAVTPELVAALKAEGKPTYVVVHANHPRELTAAARLACGRIVDAGIPMLSQSVLLHGVNDDPRILADLMRAFVETRIKPYYLHHGDLAPGTAHLRTTINTGQSLMRELRGRLSGLCQPTYVLDIPGGNGKSPIGPNYLSGDGTDAHPFAVEDYRGARHAYPPADDPSESHVD
jgi:lysine 2,3-aminomutase